MRHTLTISGVLLTVLLATASASAQDGAAPAQGSRSSVQLAFQGRIDAMGYLVPDTGGGGLASIQSITPYVTPGIRLIDGRLFVGVGIGFGGYSTKECQDTCDDYDAFSQSYFVLSPMAFFDILRAGPASLYAGGWFSFAPISSATAEIKRGAMTTTLETDAATAIGVNLAVGIRGQIVEGLSIGTEWGWAFTSLTADGNETGDARDESVTLHGIFGAVMVEGAINL